MGNKPYFNNLHNSLTINFNNTIKRIIHLTINFIILLKKNYFLLLLLVFPFRIKLKRKTNTSHKLKIKLNNGSENELLKGRGGGVQLFFLS